ncbi:hypothetical protein N7468_000415 [Penicillium chermesinum]|uniref:NACHT-NTPase and P-loop NTPases N-terminal domain-containing protein n=1 Tax=Penicillium chermesinum TaxID=63820 RepID=A0A9W9PN91_9EURO|nr:uncharacterized protein N7468_000415 [Penicillium chermesinum]KAJ5248964.1 hypothetical protein N7468_000415 [Penicillium chermesinum]KAJ6151070.1 hypothetical protein N7470_007664 [Penicillium chermesinum]
MDGLSGAASVIAVISLAVQLGSGAHTLYQFLETISDAPAELHRLQSTLSQIKAIAFGIQNALEYQRRIHGDGVPVAGDILNSLVSCEERVQQITDIVNKADGTHRGLTGVSRKWARFKVALKKERVQELEQQLGNSLQVLNVLMTTNLM